MFHDDGLGFGGVFYVAFLDSAGRRHRSGRPRAVVWKKRQPRFGQVAARSAAGVIRSWRDRRSGI